MHVMFRVVIPISVLIFNIIVVVIIIIIVIMITDVLFVATSRNLIHNHNPTMTTTSSGYTNLSNTSHKDADKRRKKMLGHIYINLYTVHRHVYMYTYKQTCVYACTHMYIVIYIYVYIYMYMYICIQTYIHVHTSRGCW